MNAETILDAALAMAAAGWPILPLRGKIPLTDHGLHDSSRAAEQIGAWWRRWPSANVGIALPITVIVLDIDPRNGGLDGYAELTADRLPMPETLTARSGRRDGGRHVYLQHPGGPLTSTLLPSGLDLKEGGKGYVVAPPSIHPATGHPYEWETTAPVAECPGWLAELIRRPAPAARPRSDGPAPASALVSFVQGLQEGGRNAGLYWAACRAVDDNTIDLIEVELLDAALGVGLPLAEANAVIRSARGGR